ncbi:hypothetical protein PIB30_037184 [Stylosanthes scabra]|uniref:Uncharacterized protein n=1 Tax=Stylosanthes scabra TaxID=79078 RepID=A0ABU6VFS8_9FABA|nr:hypothetical protein [Stylosanthes scabra]
MNKEKVNPKGKFPGAEERLHGCDRSGGIAEVAARISGRKWECSSLVTQHHVNEILVLGGLRCSLDNSRRELDTCLSASLTGGFTGEKSTVDYFVREPVASLCIFQPPNPLQQVRPLLPLLGRREYDLLVDSDSMFCILVIASSLSSCMNNIPPSSHNSIAPLALCMASTGVEEDCHSPLVTQLGPYFSAATLPNLGEPKAVFGLEWTWAILGHGLNPGGKGHHPPELSVITVLSLPPS